MRTESILAALAMAGPALAAPVSDDVSLVQNLPPTKQFSIQQEPSDKKVLRNGQAAYAKALTKYGKTPSASLTQAAASRQSGEVEADPQQYDQAYLCPVNIGGKTVNLDFDTGSADL